MALPAGLDVVEVVEARTPGLPERLEASLWQVELPGVEPGDAAAALEAFLAAPEVQVQRLMKTGMRTFDARAAVVRAEVRSRDAAPRRAPHGGRTRTVRSPPVLKPGGCLCDTATWSFGTPHPPYDPTTSWPPSGRTPTSRRRHPPG